MAAMAAMPALAAMVAMGLMVMPHYLMEAPAVTAVTRGNLAKGVQATRQGPLDWR